MKIKVVAFFVDCGNQKYLKLCKACEEVDREYCKLHGYDLEFTYLKKQDVIDFFGGREDVVIEHYKIPFIKQQLDKQDADYVVVLDTDATISKPTIKIEDLVDDKHDMFLSRGNEKVLQINLLVEVYNKIHQILQREQTEHYLVNNYYDQTIMKEYDFFRLFEWLSMGYLQHNEGFMIFKNTQLMRDFWSDCRKYQEIFINMNKDIVNEGKDCRVIKFTLLQDKYKDIFTFMPEFAQGGLANAFETHYDEDKTFVVHNFGSAMTLDQKINFVESLKTNKWWKEILK